MSTYFEDLHVGDRVVTDGRTVTEADVLAFAKLSGDAHPLHVDVAAAAAGPFGVRVAHSALILAVARGLQFAHDPMQDENALAAYGLDRVRFLRPVPMGTTVHLETEVIGLELKEPGRGLVTSRWEVKNELGEVAVVLEKRELFKTRAYDSQHSLTPSHADKLGR